MGRGTQCFKQWLRDHCECTRRVCGCAACGQNHEFGTPCSWRVYMLLLLLLCDARNLFIVFFFFRFHVGLHDIVEPSMHSQVCAPTRRRLFAQQLQLPHLHLCLHLCFLLGFVSHFVAFIGCAAYSAAAGYSFTHAQVLSGGGRVCGHGIAGVLGVGIK